MDFSRLGEPALRRYATAYGLAVGTGGGGGGGGGCGGGGGGGGGGGEGAAGGGGGGAAKAALVAAVGHHFSTLDAPLREERKTVADFLGALWGGRPGGR